MELAVLMEALNLGPDDTDLPPAARLVGLILGTALRADATEIRFEPRQDEFKVRYRVDGTLYDMESPPRFLGDAVLARLRILAPKGAMSVVLQERTAKL